MGVRFGGKHVIDLQASLATIKKHASIVARATPRDFSVPGLLPPGRVQTTVDGRANRLIDKTVSTAGD